MELNCSFLGYRKFNSKDGHEFTIVNFANDSVGSFDCFVPSSITLDFSKLKFLTPCVCSFTISTDNRNQLQLRLAGVVV